MEKKKKEKILNICVIVYFSSMDTNSPLLRRMGNISNP
jgi:hypothetical protein